MKRLSILSLTLVVLVAARCVDAAEPINMGGVPASLGADQQTLLESLRKEYDVKEMRTNTYVVFKGDPSENTIGVVQFEADKLVWASRDVGAYGGQAVRDFAQALVRLLAEISPEERTPVRISATPGTPLGFGSVMLEFQGRTVAIDVSYVEQIVDVSIEEILYIDKYADMFAPPAADKPSDAGRTVAAPPATGSSSPSTGIPDLPSR